MTTYQSWLMAHMHLRSKVSFSRKRAFAIMCRQYVVQFQLGTTYQTVEIHQLSDRITAVERKQPLHLANQNGGCTVYFCVLSCNIV